MMNLLLLLLLSLTIVSSMSLSFKALILRHGQTDANAAFIEQGSADFSRLTSLGRQQAIDAYQGLLLNDPDDTTTTTTTGGCVPRITSIYSSPLTRARETLQGLRQTDTSLLLPSTDLIMNDLREIDLYDWEGKHENELQTKFAHSWKAFREGLPNKFIVLDTTNKNKNKKNEDDSSSTTTTTSCCVEEQRYPLLEMWERADHVWDEIFKHQQQLSFDPMEDNEEDKDKNENKKERRIALIVAHGNFGQALLGTAMGWDATQFNVHQFPNCGIAEIEFSNYKNRQPGKRWRFKWPLPSSKWNY